MPKDEAALASFREKVWERGRALYRDLPWRNTRDAYAVMLSEVMLQQTQVARVLGRWEQWLDAFPTVADLAAAPLPPVLELWQGMGYNRRALNLKRCAEEVMGRFGGEIPRSNADLQSLPGIGPATAAGVRVFAYAEPDLYLETNVRAVFLHELFPDEETVSDAELRPLVVATCPQGPEVRDWYYALLDYGAHLKKTLPNPSRRSKQHSIQSKFEGSRRQKRAYLLRRVLEGAATTEALAEDLNAAETAAGRTAVPTDEVAGILRELEQEGFIVARDGQWSCAE